MRAGVSKKELAEKTGFSIRTIYRWENGETKPRKVAVNYLRNLVFQSDPHLTDGRRFTFIDLFAGIGGLRQGFEYLGGRCVFTSEWNKFCRLTYLANYKCDNEVAGDITQIHENDIPSHDVLLAGFPCQPFSIAGVSKKNSLKQPHGFQCSTQGNLFFDIVRIIKKHQPRAFLLENVKHLLSHNKGHTFNTIRDILTSYLGYQIHWNVIDARSWVPQNRKRIFIVGFREENNFTFDNFVVPPPERGPRLESVLHPEDGSEIEEHPYTIGEFALVSEKYTLSENLWNYLQKYAQKHRLAGNGFGYGLVNPTNIARTLSARYYKDGSEILIEQKGKNPRRLTPRECSRLMGFDNAEKNSFIIPVSDTQAYRQFGNSVVVPCVKAIACHMAPWLGVDTVGEIDLHQMLIRNIG